MTRSSRKAVPKKILFGLGFCCLVLVCLEIAFRLFLGFTHGRDIPRYRLYSDFFPEHAMYIKDDYLFWRGNPNWKGTYMGIEVELNSHGLRDVEFPLHKEPGTYRILSLGESGTFGSTVAFEDTYNKQLEVLLNTHNRNPERRFQVINAGQLSHSSFQGLLYLKRFGLAFGPDLIMTYFKANDSLPSYFVATSTRTGFWDLFHYESVGPGITDRELFQRRQKFFRLMKTLNRSALYKSLCAVILRVKSAFAFRVQKGQVQEREGLKTLTRLRRVPDEDRRWVFSQFISIAERLNIELLVLIPPYCPDIHPDDSHGPFSWIHPSDNVHILDLGKAFKESPYSHDELFSDDIHPTVLSNRIIAQTIFDYLRVNAFARLAPGKQKARARDG